MALSFAFLVLKEHPYGQEMLRVLLVRGFKPGILIEEVSAVADQERQKFLVPLPVNYNHRRSPN